MWTVAEFCCLFIRLFEAGEQKSKMHYFHNYDGLRATHAWGNLSAIILMIQPCEKRRMLSRFTFAIGESMAGVGGRRRFLSGESGFLVISGIAL